MLRSELNALLATHAYSTHDKVSADLWNGLRAAIDLIEQLERAASANCPLGLEKTPEVCSAGYCDVCKTRNNFQTTATASMDAR